MPDDFCYSCQEFFEVLSVVLLGCLSRCVMLLMSSCQECYMLFRSFLCLSRNILDVFQQLFSWTYLRKCLSFTNSLPQNILSCCTEVAMWNSRTDLESLAKFQSAGGCIIHLYKQGVLYIVQYTVHCTLYSTLYSVQYTVHVLYKVIFFLGIF